ncbi:MAG: pirin family protein [Deltaproteobacteria bacterium]|nr:MAG: pirin family protein [Deltaproteobacteria bacterium]
MAKIREIRSVLKSQPTVEGAGVHLKRAFGYQQVPELDPFLLLDDFHSNNPDEYIRGFPWHPHRGIETITYVLYGKVEHGDSMGNKGTISSGDIQWMTAGRGIIHQEMPKGQEDGLMWGFQLWANLPASHKMMNPRYQEIKSNQVPEITQDGGVSVKIICGQVHGVRGPVKDIVIDPEYLDIRVPSESHFTHAVKRGHKAFAYVIEGEGYFDRDRDEMVGPESLVIFDDGDEVAISSEEGAVRALFVSGKPIGEPVAWHGPIVMNTQEELRIAFEEYEKGTFIKEKK